MATGLKEIDKYFVYTWWGGITGGIPGGVVFRMSLGGATLSVGNDIPKHKINIACTPL